jgi:hypothetical protein
MDKQPVAGGSGIISTAGGSSTDAGDSQIYPIDSQDVCESPLSFFD